MEIIPEPIIPWDGTDREPYGTDYSSLTIKLPSCLEMYRLFWGFSDLFTTVALAKTITETLKSRCLMRTRSSVPIMTVSEGITLGSHGQICELGSKSQAETKTEIHGWLIGEPGPKGFKWDKWDFEAREWISRENIYSALPSFAAGDNKACRKAALVFLSFWIFSNFGPCHSCFWMTQ